MAFTIETGEIVAGANAYISYSEYVAYHTDRGSIPAETQANIEAAIVRATAYIDGNYRARWKGVKTQPLTQSLEFPRTGIQISGNTQYGYASIPYNTIPQAIKDATAEGAKRELTARLSADATTGVKRQKVDVIETEYFSNNGTTPRYKAIDDLLSALLKNGNEAIRG